MRARMTTILATVALLLAGAACQPAAVQLANATSSETPAPTFTAEQLRFFDWVHQVETTVPRQLVAIRWCEAGSYIGLPWGQTNYQAYNQAGSSASGGYQILDGTWRAWRGYFPFASQYARAAHAPSWIQDGVATEAYRRHGSTPWNASRSCWG